MYNLPHFKASDKNDIFTFMDAHPFITLCGVDDDGKPVATHLPVLLAQKDDQLFLQGHLMLKQNHTSAFEDNSNVLAIFCGANAYISASHYTQKNVASTWNYQAVHASGIIHFKDDDFLYKLLNQLTKRFENNQNSPSHISNIPDEYMQKNMKAIVGIEIEVTNIEHIFKLSQNIDQESRDNIINHLQKSDNVYDNYMAKTMKAFYK